MCQKCLFLFPRAHFLGATHAPTEPVHEFISKPPYCILSRPSHQPKMQFKAILGLLRPGIIKEHLGTLTLGSDPPYFPESVTQ